MSTLWLVLTMTVVCMYSIYTAWRHAITSSHLSSLLTTVSTPHNRPRYSSIHIVDTLVHSRIHTYPTRSRVFVSDQCVHIDIPTYDKNAADRDDMDDDVPTRPDDTPPSSDDDDDADHCRRWYSDGCSMNGAMNEWEWRYVLQTGYDIPCIVWLLRCLWPIVSWNRDWHLRL